MNKQSTSSVLTNLFHSAIATGLAELATLPICCVKTNYQNNKGMNISQTVRHIYANHGIIGFYKASVPAISSQIFSTASKYVVYRWLLENNPITKNMNEKNTLTMFSSKMINGIASGMISSIFTHPLDAFKIHLQMRTPFIPELQKHGLSLLYRGYSKTWSKILIGSALFFPIYDTTLAATGNPISASFISAVASTSIMHPIDYLKTRHIYGLSLFDGYNPQAYYRGLSLNLARVVPHFMIVMTGIAYLQTLTNVAGSEAGAGSVSAPFSQGVGSVSAPFSQGVGSTSAPFPKDVGKDDC